MTHPALMHHKASHHITAKKATANNNKTPHGLCCSVSDVIKQLFDNFSVVNKKQDEPCMCVSAWYVKVELSSYLLRYKSSNVLLTSSRLTSSDWD